MITDFIEESSKLLKYAQSIRRDIHRHPELGFQESRTSGLIARELEKLGIKVNTGIAETGFFNRFGRPAIE